MNTTKNKLFAWLQYLIPQHLLSRLLGRLADCRIGWVKNLLINKFIQRYKVDMSEALNPDPSSYACFNDFFTRELQPDAREILTDSSQLVSPADGAISELGQLENGQLMQAKGINYSVVRLLGGDLTKAKPFMRGSFVTIYLSHKDYHRVHLPLDGRLTETIYVPGQLFSVNQATADNIPSLFARNERLVCFFETDAGPMALIFVGALIVAGIETVWSGQVAPPARKIKVEDFSNPAEIVLSRGDEIGRFKLGSTVILVFGEDVVQWREDLTANTTVRMGESLGHIKLRE